VSRALAEEHYAIHKGKPFLRRPDRLYPLRPGDGDVWEAGGGCPDPPDDGATRPGRRPGLDPHDFAWKWAATSRRSTAGKRREETALWFKPGIGLLGAASGQVDIREIGAMRKTCSAVRSGIDAKQPPGVPAVSRSSSPPAHRGSPQALGRLDDISRRCAFPVGLISVGLDEEPLPGISRATALS